MEKLLWFDDETTGLDPVKNDIIQIAGLIEIDGSVEDEFSFTCSPYNINNLDPKALEVNRRTEAELSSFESPLRVWEKIEKILSRHVNKYKRDDKFTPAGHCVTFDIQFLDQFIRKSGDKYGFGSWGTWQAFDTMFIAVLFKRFGFINPASMKLADLCKALGVIPGDHEAMNDIRATQECGRIMYNYFTEYIGIGRKDTLSSFPKPQFDIIEGNKAAAPSLTMTSPLPFDKAIKK